jgi:hypothetical protein
LPPFFRLGAACFLVAIIRTLPLVVRKWESIRAISGSQTG